VIAAALTGMMILLFLGSFRATVAVFLSIPLSVLAAFLAIGAGGGTVNTMVLGGLALAFSRLIDNSVIVLENIFSHLERGEDSQTAAEKGGKEVALAVLAATLTTAIVFFPVVFLYGVSRFLFTALAVAVILSLFASYFVAMTVIPLFSARFLKAVHHAIHEQDEIPEEGSIGPETVSWGGRFVRWFNRVFLHFLEYYERSVRVAVKRPGLTVALLLALFVASLAIYPLLGLAFFPRTDAGQFTVNLKVPTGTRIESWDLRSDEGTTVSSGVYFARLEAPGTVLTRRLTVVR